MRRWIVLVPLLLLGALAGPGVAAPPERAGQVLHGTYPAAGVPGARDYRLYVPAHKPGKRLGLVVWLHGCNQTADDAAAGARLEEFADERGLLVLYPEQRRPASGTAPVADGNGSRCWNWFLPEHQQRGAGEPATLAGMTQDIAGRYRTDPGRIHVAGVSAGADMTTILGATYPDVFAAVAPIAGCAYGTCTDGNGTAALAAMGPHARAVPAFIVQGGADLVNNAAMGATALEQWLATDDLADDGVANGSVPRQPTRTTHHGATPGTPGSGDPCVGGSPGLPCAGGALGLDTYPYSEFDHADAAGRVVVRAWVVHGQNHAYGSGDRRGSFTDPLGPDTTRALLDFFADHRLVRSPRTS